MKFNLGLFICLFFISCRHNKEPQESLKLKEIFPKMGEVFYCPTKGALYAQALKSDEILIMPISNQRMGIVSLIEELDARWYRSGRDVIWSDNSELPSNIINGSLYNGGGYAEESAAFIGLFVDRYFVSSEIKYEKAILEPIDTISGKAFTHFIQNTYEGDIAKLDAVLIGYRVQVEHKIRVRSKNQCLVKKYYTQAHLYKSARN